MTLRHALAGIRLCSNPAPGRTLGRAAACTVAALLAALALVPSAEAAEGKSARARKPRLAVLDFPAASGAWGCSGWSSSESRMAGVLRDLFTTGISDAAGGKLRLVERERLADVRGELGFQQGGEVDAATAQKLGKLLGAQFMLTGKMTRFACKVTDAATGWGLGALVGKATGSSLAGSVAGSVKTKNVTFTGRLDARLIDVRTGEILATFKDENDTGDLSVKIAGGGVDVAYDDELANKVFEPIAARMAEKVVPKVEKAAREQQEEDADDDQPSPPRKRVASADQDAAGDAAGAGGRRARGGGQGGGDGGGGGDGPAGGSQDQVYSPRFDFVPGEKVLVFDDFSDTEPGDYPAKWTVGGLKGQVEVVEVQGKRWLKAIKPANGKDMTNSGALLRVDQKKKLPEKFTIEFDVPSSGYYNVVITDQYWFTGQDYLDFGPTFANTRNAKVPNLAAPAKPIRHVSIAVSRTNVKVYFDGERVLLDPEGLPSADPASKHLPSTIGFSFRPDNLSGTGSGPARDDLMLTNFKLAEGGKDYAKDLAVSGRIVTHGITFDSGSDVLRPESGPTLRKLLKLLQDDSALAFEIQGHTDDQGGDKVNGPLSERRARAVKAWLVGQGIEDGRLSAKGLGATKPLKPNDTPEARADNRRVELVRKGS